MGAEDARIHYTGPKESWGEDGTVCMEYEGKERGKQKKKRIQLCSERKQHF